MAKSTETQSGRRFKYGSNVVVAAVAAIVLVAMLNGISYKRFVNVRFDLTSTRRWSLSPQTTKVIKNLKNDYRLVVLISELGPYHAQAKDLIDEYGYLSSKLKIEKIDPSSESLMSKFYGELVENYTKELTPMREATEQATATLNTVRSEVKEHLTLVRKVLDSPQLKDQQLKTFIQNVSTVFAQIETEAKQIDKSLKKVQDSALPDFAAALNLLKDKYTEYDQRVFQIVIEQFNIAAENPVTPAPIKEQMLHLVKLLEKTRGHLTPIITKLEAVKTDGEYSKLRNEIGPETVVLIGAGDKPPAVIHLNEMFKEPQQEELRALQEGERPERRFLGEEKVTGALVAMELDSMPLVVFISAGQRPAIGYGGEYQQLATRLSSLNFEVTQWSVSGRMGQMGRPTPAGPPPQPKPGQKALWVVPPVPPQNPMQPNPATANNGAKIAEHIKTRIEQGDSAIVMLGVSPMAGFGAGDPIKQFVDQWSITAQTDRLILVETIDGRGRNSFSTAMKIDQWSDQSPITAAIGSMTGMFYSSCPLVIDGNPPDDTTVTPLVISREKGMWAETQLQKLQSGDLKLNPDTAAESFTIGVAIEKGDKRLIVVTDPMWATDQITTYGQLGPGTAQLFGAQFPANAELFMNSAFWLLELDELIAAGARTQDIRRIDNSMEKDSLIALRWLLLLGLPGLSLGTGIGVWLIRRRV